MLYSTLLRLPPLRFHCIRGCWDRTVATSASVVRRQKYKTLLKLVKNLVDIQIYHSLSFLYSNYCQFSILQICTLFVLATCGREFAQLPPPPSPTPPPGSKLERSKLYFPLTEFVLHPCFPTGQTW